MGHYVPNPRQNLDNPLSSNPFILREFLFINAELSWTNQLDCKHNQRSFDERNPDLEQNGGEP